MSDPDATREAQIRRQIAAHAMWGVDHAADIHYRQSRPIDGMGHYRQLPLSTDCSGFVTLCYQWGGAADPNGQGFSGYGYTGTILDHCTAIDPGSAAVGDLVVLDEGDRQHVVVLVGDGSDPAVVSHGGEYGPILTTLHKEIAAHGPPVRFVTCPDLADPAAQHHLDLTSEDDELRTKTNAATEG